MFKKIKHVTVRIVAGANIVTILLMLAVGYSAHLSPESHPLLAVAGLAFPAFLVANVAFLLFWIFFKPLYVLLPVAGFVLGYQPVHHYFPVSVPHTVPDSTLKVLTYNVRLFWVADNYRGDLRDNSIVKYVMESGADIVCLQEANMEYHREAECDSVLRTVFPYTADGKHPDHANRMKVLSRYPIIDSQLIPIESSSNLAMRARLLVEGDTVDVINVHLESIRLSYDEKDGFSQMVKGDMQRREARRESNLLVHKLSQATVRRAPQAEAVARFVREECGPRVILCGDFNDSPISYSHHTLAGVLTDCHTASGNGPGISFHDKHMYVRIDNIMCSDAWEPYDCHVDKSIDLSDHYPMLCQLKLRRQ